MELEKYSCKSHAIAYIDLLGIRSEIQTNQDGCLKNMVKALYFAKNIKEKGPIRFPFLGELKMKAFSDNIVFAIEITEETNALTALSGVVVATDLFQRMLVEECGYLSRGAITVGDLYMDEHVVWGKGLVRAYRLENDIAIFPRVILDPLLWEKVGAFPATEPEKSVFALLFKADFDKYFYVDFSAMTLKESKEFVGHLKKTYIHYEGSDDKVIQKLSWIQKMQEALEERIKVQDRTGSNQK